MNAVELILTTLDRHLHAEVELRLMGGAALILAYGLRRATEDVDLLLDDIELKVLAEQAELGDALERANRELEPHGLYLSHIWGPEQQILTPAWRESCRSVVTPAGTTHLHLTALGPLDLIASKLCRADDLDLADIRFLITTQRLSAERVHEAMQSALVPADFRDVYPASCARVEALLEEIARS